MTALRMVEQPGATAFTTQPDSVWFKVHPGLGISLMDHLYNRLDGAYPGRWRKDFPDPQSIANWQESWAEAFDDEAITDVEVKAALRQVRKRFPWPPSVAEFIQLARPPIDPDAAYHEAVAGLLARRSGHMGEWSHRAIYWAAQSMQFDLLKLGQEQMKGRWKRVLTAQLERSRHPDIPMPMPQLPAPGHSATERDMARKRLADLKAADIIKRPGAGMRLEWARAIVARMERKDPTLTNAIVADALIALGRAPIEDDEAASDDKTDNDKGASV